MNPHVRHTCEMGSRKGAEEAGEGRAKKRRSTGDDGGGGSDADADGEAERAAKKGRKVALKATRRLARALGARFRDGSEDDEGVSDDERPGPFADFPSRKEARKLSEGQRETLVSSPPPVRSLPGSVAKKVS